MRDDSGQLIIISGFIIALGVITLTIMLNSVIYAGNSAYEGTMDMPSNNIQYLDQLTCREANNAYYYANSSGTFDINKYNSYMGSYSKNLTLIYAQKGDSVQVTGNSFDQTNKIATANIVYNDTVIAYQHSASINIAPKSLSDSLMTPVVGNPIALGLVVGSSYRDVNGTVNVSTSTTITFTVTLLDKSGAEIRAQNIPVNVSTTYGTLDKTFDYTTSSGYATFHISSSNPGIATITVYSPGLTSATLHVKFY